MYKAGKKWVFAAITTASVITGLSMTNTLTYAANTNDPTTAQNAANTNDPTTAQNAANINDPTTAQNAANINDSHIQEINGQTYFVGDNGQVKKNFTAIINGQSLYFNKTTGALASNNAQYESGLVKINDIHNAAYSIDPTGLTNVNGYLTANSWYRPTYIYKNGKQWVKSTARDMRPLLMTWWPDKNTQVAYLQYMQKMGLLSNKLVISNKTKQLDLTNESLTTQANIEKQISLKNSTEWLKNYISNFVNSQSNWNLNSESKGTDHLQGGALLYVNSNLTPEANSNYRLLNRTPVNQRGQITDTSQMGGYEMLLANDVDNSNPVVQAEQLNWLYYMMNIGSITANDSSANFDGYRVDAVDNVDADLLQIAADYSKDAYKTNQNDANANKHLSILEDWNSDDPTSVKENGNNQLSMDFPVHLAIKYSLNMPVDQRSGLEPELTTSLVNRSGDDSTENIAQPNYSFIRAHDSEVQTVIAQIIKDKIDPNSDGLTVTPSEISQAFKIYNSDELLANKQYTAYNIPSSYAILLTNKDTVPRVYYGDLYTDDGQYMSAHSPYFNAITSLLKTRIKYVSGGQNMGVQYMQGSSSGYNGVLTSVRYGKGEKTATDQGNAGTRTQGIGVIISNNPNLKLNSTDQVVLNMGAAHKNQTYRPVLLTTKDGLENYDSDKSVPQNDLVSTNNKGQLIFNASSIQGVSNPQVSGYLSAWVPVGATDSQDARTVSSTQPTTDGETYHSNAALDSQVIYEGFSNFQSIPTKTTEFTNVKIAQNANLFKSLGITSFELAPQYRSSNDNSFLDSVIQNGYAFTDRYDVGYNTPTKYGTTNQLLNALRSLHAAGIQAIDDWVPDQIYNLPGEEIVSATRTNDAGIYDQDSVIDDTLYDSHTVGGGYYQKKFGGAFLDKLKQMYPDLFTVKQISTGQPMNPNEKITEWSAKYFNGSNIQGRGAWYVLKDWATNQYFNVENNKFVPKQLLGEDTSTGFNITDNGVEFYSTSGYKAQKTFIQDGDNWYYFDDNGHMVTGSQNINDNNYYLLPNGIELQDSYLLNDDTGKEYYYSINGQQIANRYYQDTDGNWRYFFNDGSMAKGLTTIEQANGTKVIQYFDSDGIQLKGNAVRDDSGNLRYFDGNTGNMLINSFGELPNGTWIYLNNDGVAVTGKQKINNQNLYFDTTGIQIKGNTVKNSDGTINYYDGNTGDMVKNSFAELPNGSWLYLDENGNAVTGSRVINGEKMYFMSDGTQVKGKSILGNDGNYHYYDPNSGVEVS